MIRTLVGCTGGRIQGAHLGLEKIFLDCEEAKVIRRGTVDSSTVADSQVAALFCRSPHRNQRERETGSEESCQGRKCQRGGENRWPSPLTVTPSSLPMGCRVDQRQFKILMQAMEVPLDPDSPSATLEEDLQARQVRLRRNATTLCVALPTVAATSSRLQALRAQHVRSRVKDCRFLALLSSLRGLLWAGPG